MNNEVIQEDGLIEYEDRFFESYEELCKTYKVDYKNFMDRKNSGLSIEDCLIRSLFDSITKGGEDKNHNKIKYEGKTYSSYVELCKTYEVNYNTFKIKKSKGLSLEECLAKSQNIIEYNGKIYSSKRKLCQDYDINYITFLDREKRGLSIEECLSEKHFSSKSNNTSYKELQENCNEDYTRNIVRTYKYSPSKEHTNGIKIEYKGKNYTSYKELCYSYGANYSTFRARKNRGLSIEECLEKVSHNHKRISHNGKDYTSYQELCKDYEVNYGTFITRKRKCLSLKDCLQSEGRVTVSPITYNNKTYPSYKELCKEYNVKYDTFAKRRAKGLSLEESL